MNNSSKKTPTIVVNNANANVNSLSMTAPIRDVYALTKFERIKVIGERAEELARGAQPFVDVPEVDPAFDPTTIAERELDQGKLPFIVDRLGPNGTHVYIRLAK